MKLLVDIGNSLTKIAVTEKGGITTVFKAERMTEPFVGDIFSAYPGITACILSSVREDISVSVDFIRSRCPRVMMFNHHTPIPVKNTYETPHTLGMDRLAAAVGAHTIFPGRNVLIVDFGSALTIDLLSRKGEFSGGNISPGAGLRFKVLHQHTDKLPLCTLSNEPSGSFGTDTGSAIRNGVINGIVFEIEGYIEQIKASTDDPAIIFTGGDADFFAEMIKNTIFVDQQLIFKGLYRVLEYNGWA